MAESVGGSGTRYTAGRSSKHQRFLSSRRAPPSQSSASDEFQDVLESRNAGLSQRVFALESSIQSLHQTTTVRTGCFM